MKNIRSTCAFVVAALLAATAASALDPAAPPAAVSPNAGFEVASVKPSNPTPDPNNPLSGFALMLPQPGGRFTANNTPLRMLIMAANELQQDAQLVGGPPALLAAKYDITARAAGTAMIGKELPQLLRSLLADRFKLKTHTETRELPVYDLVIARSDGRLGPELKPSKSDCAKADGSEQAAALANGDVSSFVGKPRPCSVSTDPSGGPLNLMMRGDGQEIMTLVETLTVFTGRAVRDKTGLTGRYDFELTFDPEVLMRMVSQMGLNIPVGALPPSNAPSLLTALQEQLGLKLENEKAPGQVLVIDSAELPMPD